jgi:hypothetical protein
MPAAMFCHSSLLDAYGFHALFSERHGGVSEAPFDSLNLGYGVGDVDTHVAENMQRLCHASGVPIPHCANQVHGVAVLDCSGAGKHHAIAADALITQSKQTAVAVRTADCVPILLADPYSGIVAAVHAGWRGTAQSIVTRCCEAMCRRGARRELILASIGPAIGACCFAIQNDVYQALAKAIPDQQHEGLLQAEATLRADLAAINRRQLQCWGMDDARIEMLSPCTACHPERFFSYRRDDGVTGRQLAIIATR